ncbi:MAG: RNA pseudouridine synthase, partial [Porticoccus sp.]|nr:RNA pseudouridine synthase [Porticoccus sp.]
MTDPIKLEATVPLDSAGTPLDQVAAELFDNFSRSRLQQWIKSGDLLVDGKQYRPKDKLIGGENLTIDAIPEAEGVWEPEPISLNITYEDDHILVINKPAG